MPIPSNTFRLPIALLIALAAVSPVVTAAEETQHSPKVVVIRAGKLIDTEAGRVLTNQVIVIEGERIKSVGPAGVAIPANAEVIDLSQATVLPGLIDVHTHLTSNATMHGYRSLGISNMRAALYGVRAARLTLEAGFTTVRNVGADGYGDVALRDAINDGDTPGPRMQVSANALGIKGGHCDETLLPPELNVVANGVADGPWPARAKVREMVKYGADLIKICASGGVLSKGDTPGAPQYTLEEMKAIVEEAHKLGRKVAAHAHGTISIRDAIIAGVDSIEHASYIDAEGIRLAKEKGTFLSMDIYNDDYILAEGEKAGFLPESLEKERQVGLTQRNNFKKAHQAGARMAFGTDAGVYPHGDNAKQFATMVQFGMSPMQALQAATVNSAELMGWKADIGSITPGKYADIIATDADPLQDVTRLGKVSFVMKGGQVVKRVGR